MLINGVREYTETCEYYANKIAYIRCKANKKKECLYKFDSEAGFSCNFKLIVGVQPTVYTKSEEDGLGCADLFPC